MFKIGFANNAALSRVRTLFMRDIKLLRPNTLQLRLARYQHAAAHIEPTPITITS